MELKEGMYVRTDKGQIGKIIKIEKGYKEKPLYFLDIDLPNYAHIEEEFIKEPSFNIKALIEVGDYVNGDMVVDIEENGWISFSNNSYRKCNYVESIVTKEQFESMSYKVDD